MAGCYEGNSGNSFLSTLWNYWPLIFFHESSCIRSDMQSGAAQVLHPWRKTQIFKLTVERFADNLPHTHTHTHTVTHDILSEWSCTDLQLSWNVTVPSLVRNSQKQKVRLTAGWNWTIYGREFISLWRLILISLRQILYVHAACSNFGRETPIVPWLALMDPSK